MTDAKTIREVPFYLRARIRTVHEIMQSARMQVAANNKAMGVYDYSQLFA